jgi:hypothetical protein
MRLWNVLRTLIDSGTTDGIGRWQHCIVAATECGAMSSEVSAALLAIAQLAMDDITANGEWATLEEIRDVEDYFRRYPPPESPATLAKAGTADGTDCDSSWFDS